MAYLRAFVGACFFPAGELHWGFVSSFQLCLELNDFGRRCMGAEQDQNPRRALAHDLIHCGCRKLPLDASDFIAIRGDEYADHLSNARRTGERQHREQRETAKKSHSSFQLLIVPYSSFIALYKEAFCMSAPCPKQPLRPDGYKCRGSIAPHRPVTEAVLQGSLSQPASAASISPASFFGASCGA